MIGGKKIEQIKLNYMQMECQPHLILEISKFRQTDERTNLPRSPPQCDERAPTVAANTTSVCVGLPIVAPQAWARGAFLCSFQFTRKLYLFCSFFQWFKVKVYFLMGFTKISISRSLFFIRTTFSYLSPSPSTKSVLRKTFKK